VSPRSCQLNPLTCAVDCVATLLLVQDLRVKAALKLSIASGKKPGWVGSCDVLRAG
jgi:hypothetical protein